MDRIGNSIAGALLLCTLNVAESAPAWLDKEYGYFAQEESLRNLLYDFAASVSIPAVISPKVTASVSGNFPAIKARNFLAQMAKAHRLSWIYDGTTLYVYDVSEVQEKTAELPYRLVRKFREYIEAIDVQGVPLDWRAVPAQNILQLSGPPRFIALATEIIDRVKAQSVRPSSRGGVVDAYVVRVFHIEYAYVDESGNNASGNKAPIVSLAEMLGNIMNVAHISNVVGSGVGGGTKKLFGTGLADQKAAAQPTAPVPANQIAGNRESEAYIIGDPRLNAIIVRDLESRMPIYEHLIQELDKPLDQIEIEVSIIDIDASEVENFGFRWTRDSEAPGLSVNFNTTLDAAEVTGFLLNVTALENKGKSRILARPSVLTLDNHEASLQNNQTFYVRLGVPDDGSSGAAVDLIPVSYGVTLKVRPHVVYEGDKRKIQLAVHVEDGRRVAGADVSQLPTVAQNVIQTQAVINEGQSLLIGGYNIRERVFRQERIPLLGYVPVVGFFFTSTAESDVSVARYFVITPRIVDTSINYRIETGFEDESDEAADAAAEGTAGQSGSGRSHPGPP